MRRWVHAALAAVSLTFGLAAPTMADQRVIYYPQENPPSTQANLVPRYFRIALGNALRDLLSLNPAAGGVYDNLLVSAATGMNVTVGPAVSNTQGTLYQIIADDANPLPVGYTPQLAADPTFIAVEGQQAGASAALGPMTAPPSGDSVYYLVEAQLQSTDTNPTSELFVNASGQKSYQNVNVTRQDAIVYQLKAGTAGGSPVAPTVDSGWIAIGYVLVPSGTAQITSGMISMAQGFTGFVQQNGVATLSGLTMASLSAGCVNVNGIGAFESLPCTSGIGTVQGTSPIVGNTVSGIATLGCPTCVTSVTASGNIASSGGTTPNLTFTGTLPIANGGCNATSYTSGDLLYFNGTSCASFLPPLTVALGGTNATSYTSGAPLYYNGTSFASAVVSSPLAFSVGTLACGTCAVTNANNNFSAGQSTPTLTLTQTTGNQLSFAYSHLADSAATFWLGAGGLADIQANCSVSCVTAVFSTTGNWTVPGFMDAGGASGPTCTAGDVCASRSTTTGAINIGGSSSACLLDYGVTTAATFTSACPLSASDLYARNLTASNVVGAAASGQLVNETLGNGLTQSGNTLSVNNCGAAICRGGLNIAVCYQSGAVSTSASCPTQDISSTIVGGQITKLAAFCTGLDNGTTVFTLYTVSSSTGARTSVGTLTLSSTNYESNVVITTVNLTSPEGLYGNVTTAGTASGCTFSADGTQEVQ